MTFRGSIGAVCAAAALAVACSAAHAQAAAVEARFNGNRDLLVDFTEPVQAWDNRIGNAWLRVQPELPRTCRWDSDTRLACRLEREVTPATRYRIEITAGLKNQAGVDLPAQTLYAESARPSLHARIVEWRGGRPRIELFAPVQVTAQAVQSALRLWVDGRPVPAPLPSRQPKLWNGEAARFSLEMPPIDGDDRTRPFRVSRRISEEFEPLIGLSADLYDVAELRHRATLTDTLRLRFASREQARCVFVWAGAAPGTSSAES